MSKLNNNTNNSYIFINSLITLNLISDDNTNNNYSKYIVRLENSDDKLTFKLCKKPLFEYLELSESIFYIRDIEECKSIYDANNSDNNGISCKEIKFSKNDRVNQSTQFYLQHMISGKFISTHINLDNNKITIILVNEIENAYPFSLRKINEARSSAELLNFGQIFYLSIEIKEEKQFYYLFEDELLSDKIESDKKYFDIILDKRAVAKFKLINQTMMINQAENIYSGQLTNIIFLNEISGQIEKFMLGIEEKKENLIESENNNNKNQDKYKVVPYLYTDELSEQVLEKAFWVIEQNNSDCCECLEKEPIKIKEGFRIKSPCTGLYLSIKHKNIIKSNYNINNKSSLNKNEKSEYEFCLIDNETINNNLFFENNFKFYHYIISDENKYIVDDGKYIIKGIFENFNKEEVLDNHTSNEIFDYNCLEQYYLPIFLILNDSSVNKSGGFKRSSISNEIISKKEYVIKNEDDFMFVIKKTDILKGSEVIFIHKIIMKLENDLKNQQLNINTLNDWISFLIEYLINIEYSYRDNNHETNVPIKERQILLWKYNVINIISNILNYYLDDNKNAKKKIKNQKMQKLLFNIIKFLLYLSKEKEDIKISIYMLNLNLIIEFGQEILDDNAKLLFFIFELINDSEILQNYLLGDSSLLKQYIINNPSLSIIDINNLIKIDKILDFIEVNSNFLVLYQNLLNLNKVEYKYGEILNHIQSHINQVKLKEKNRIANETNNNINYLTKMKLSIYHAKFIIKNNSILLDYYINLPDEVIQTRRTRLLRNSIMPKANLNFNFLNKNKSILKENTPQEKDLISTEFQSKKSNEIFSNPQKYMRKLEFTDTIISEEENDSRNPTIKSNAPLINNRDSDEYIKSSLFNHKESERQTLIDEKEKRRSSEIRSTIKLNKGIIKSFSNINTLKTLRPGKFSVDKIENKEEEEKKLTKQDYKNILNKFGKIWYFLKWYETFDLNHSLFVHDKFLKEIFNDKIKKQIIEKKLYYFLKGKMQSSVFIKDLNINADSGTGILYLFRLYNALFPEIGCKLETKINKKENITGSEIVEDMNEDYTLDKEYEEKKEEDELSFQRNLNLDRTKLDEYLSSFYSSYQFYINQYVGTVHKIFIILSNYFLNSDNFGNLKEIKDCFKETLRILLSRIVFNNDDIVEYLYSKIKLNPSLLSGCFDFEEIKNKSIQIISDIRKNSNRNYEISNFFSQKKNIIEYLYLMCKKCDEIKYLYEKVTVFKYIRNFIFSRSENYQIDTELDNNKEIENQFKSILELISTKKRIPILTLFQKYEKFNNKNKSELTLEEKNKLGLIGNNYSLSEKVDSWGNQFYEVFKVGQIVNFIVESLKHYDIEEFFNNIIYIENKEYIISHEDKVIKKIRRIIDLFSDVENEILNIKISSISKNNNINNKYLKLKKYESTNYILAKIKNDSLELFDEAINNPDSSNILCKKLYMENKKFYEKIHFIQTLKLMVEALNYYKDKEDQSKLEYISSLLRIFSEIKVIYPNFNKTILDNFELYSTLIIESLNYLSQYPNTSNNIKIETKFLMIFYYGVESFLYIVKNCKIDFIEIKDFMTEVFQLLLNICSQFKTKKNKLIYKILYFYTVSRILLYLNKEKTYDFYSYKLFYNNIFPIHKIKEYFFNQNQDNKKTEELNNKGIIICENEENFDDKSSDSEKNNLDISNFNNLPDEMQTYKLDEPQNDKSNIINNRNENEIFNNFKEKETMKSFNENLEMYDAGEFERLVFFEKFLLVYSLYLNEKNSIMKDKDEDINDKNHTDELYLNSLYKNLKPFLLNNNKDNYLNNHTNSNKTQERNISLIDSYYNDTSQFEEKIDFQNENINFEKSQKDFGFLFIFSIFQAIVNFQFYSRDKNIEIPIKNKIEKEGELYNSESEETNEKTENDSGILLTDKTNSIIFYYYEYKYIDIILIEKIINEISIKKNLRNYCLSLWYEGNYIVPETLKRFLKDQLYYKLITKNYDNNEYNIINNLYIKNNMPILINNILNEFNQNDLSDIEIMKNFLFKKMGEIYNNEALNQKALLDEKNFNLIDYLKQCENKNNPEFIKINLITFFGSLIYIYPKYEKKLCLHFYKLGFEMLYSNCYLINNQKKKEDENSNKQFNLELIIKTITFLFKIKSNRLLIEDKYVFNTMLSSMRELYKCINGTFILKYYELVKEFLSNLDFILGHLSRDFHKIVQFLERPENLGNSNKFKKKKNKLEITLNFFIELLNFKKNFEEKVLTPEIMKFAEEIIERAIKLLNHLIEIDKEKSIEIMNILLNFLYEFIKGPDIENINMLFSLGFFDLVTFTITNIDYYKLFLSYLNKDNMHEVIDNFAVIECRIIKIFIAYYNISYSQYSKISEFEKLQKWYENNFKFINKKLKKLFYISEKEMEKRQYDINKMLLFIKEDDDKYSDEELNKRAGNTISDDNYEENKEQSENNNNDTENSEKNIGIKKYLFFEEEVEEKEKNNSKFTPKLNKFCLIKFDLLLSYYTLFNYHKDLSDYEEDKNPFATFKKRKKNIFYRILNFLIDLVKFLINLIIVLVLFIYFFSKRFTYKKKEDFELLQELADIDFQCQNYNEKKIINFLKNYIKEIEISLNNVIYKIYFPMIDKANTLQDYKKEYLNVEEIDSSDFTNYLLSNYDYINIRAKQNALINKWIDEFPIFNYIFKNMYIYEVLLIILGLFSNLLIMTSFSTFDEEKKNCFIYEKAISDKRIQCPFFFFKDTMEPKTFKVFLQILILIELILQGLTFLDYLMRKLAVESEIVKLNYEIDKLKLRGKKSKIKVNKYIYVFYIAFPTIYRCFFNFQTIYYILSLLFLALGISLHPFFSCVILLEFVNRIPLMQTILKAMYKPAKDILINLLMFIILEYFFSLFAVSWYRYHFPNEKDTSTFLKVFMRMMDQTFKQDGGIGTYLQKSLDDDFLPFSTSSYFNSRFFFDLIFFVVILLLIFQMFLSIIIDYFNETRENNETFEDTLETQCIVCGFEREKIEKINTNDKDAFDNHIKYNHNVFNYIYYLMYLQSSYAKDVIIDNSVWDLHLVKDLSYLPKKQCFKQSEKRCWHKLNKSKNEDKED